MMSCPTCDHTMHRIGENLWWCPRCGSIQGDYEAAEAPKLVHRCREFERSQDFQLTALNVRTLWRSIGIAESIDPPEESPS